VAEPPDIVQATPADLSTVFALLAEAAHWLKAQGVGQWTHYLDTEPPEDLPDALRAGEVWLVCRHGKPVATISLQMAPADWDRGIWGAAVDESAAYVHRLAVSRAAAGAGLGDAMLDWAEAKARSAGKRYVRLDCVGHNQKLNAYYQRRFAFAGEAAQIGMRFHRYEKQVGGA
jgi:GNAT superfamily N-acetyltransferase